MQSETVNAADKAEWIAERAAIAWEGNGGVNNSDYLAAEMLARRCWEDTFGDPQKKLF